MDMNSQTEAEEHFDGVLLCTGMRQKGWRPAKWRMEMEFKVMEKKGGIWRNNEYLKGKVLHAEDFTNAADYRDQTVCVVGMGNSAVEIAAALAPSAKQVNKKYTKHIFSITFDCQVLLSTRRGAWLLNRVCPSGQPWDWHFHTRWHSQMRKWVPKMGRSKFSQLSSNSHAMLPINPNRENGRPEHNLHRLTKSPFLALR
jgi:dimethylaniline monooxygenase (N-oxide forming)